MAYVVPGNRGGTILIYEGHRYQKNKERGDKVFWRCWHKRHCKVYLQTALFDPNEDNPNIIVLHEPKEHNHEDDMHVITASSVKERMLDMIEANPSRPVKRVYNEVVMDADEEEDDHIPEFRQVRSTLNRKRASLLPPIPHVVEEVVVENEWAETWRGRPFLSHQDNDWGILIFATEQNYAKLRRCVTVTGLKQCCHTGFSATYTLALGVASELKAYYSERKARTD